MNETLGLCHFCHMDSVKGNLGPPQLKQIAYCGVCDHWFCAWHRWALFRRGKAFVDELIAGFKPDNCCGPLQRDEVAA